ncbi:MAG: FAD-dependent oxidoreductase [Planctomycetota bacterium]
MIPATRRDVMPSTLHAIAALASRLLVGYTFVRHGDLVVADPPLLVTLLLALGGICLLAGVGTRLCALLLAGHMILLLATAERMRLVAATVPGGDFGLLEVAPLVLLMLLFWLAVRGAGRFALDQALQRRLAARAATVRAADAVEPTRIVILGGGFGGLYAGMRLERIFADDPHVEVTVVNQDNFLLFTPMLHEVAASDLDLTHVVSATRKLLQHARFVNGEVRGIDLARRTVTIAHGEERREHRLRYDHLVVGLGSVTNFYGLPGLAEGAFTMRTLGDAIALRNRLIASMEEASVVDDPEQRARLLTFVVAGGGFAGVETIAAINDFARETLRFYPRLSPADLRVVLVHSGDRILPELSGSLGRYAQEKLTARGVEVRLQARVQALNARGVALADGTELPTRTLVWTAGTAPHPLLATLPCAKERGRIVVEATMAVPQHPGIWALGDCAAVPDLVRGGSCPPTAQHATRQGTTLADNLAAAMRGRPLRPFRFRMLGQLAALGRRSGVAQVFGMRFSGFVAWWLWRSIYLSKLPGFERKVRVAVDWSLDLLFTKDLVKCPTDRGPAAPVAGEPSVAADGVLQTLQRQT